MEKIKKGDIVRVSRGLLERYQLKPGKYHADIYGLTEPTQNDIEEWSMLNESYDFLPEYDGGPPDKIVEYLNTGDLYIVERSRVARPKHRSTLLPRITGCWCRVSNFRDGRSILVKTSTLEKV